MPPPDLTVQQVVEVTFTGTVFNQTIMNKLHYRVDAVAGGTMTQPAAFAALQTQLALPGSLYGLYALFLPQDWTGTLNKYQVVRPQRYVAFDFITTSFGGGNLQNTLTTNLAACLTKRGNMGQRSNISTSHFLLTDNPAFVDGGVLTNGSNVALTLLAAQIRAQQAVTVGPATATLTPVIWSARNPTVTTDITSTIIQQTARVMRRRTVGLGI